MNRALWKWQFAGSQVSSHWGKKSHLYLMHCQLYNIDTVEKQIEICIFLPGFSLLRLTHSNGEKENRSAQFLVFLLLSHTYRNFSALRITGKQKSTGLNLLKENKCSMWSMESTIETTENWKAVFFCFVQFSSLWISRVFFPIWSVFSLASRYVMCTFATTCAWNGKHISIHFPSHKMSTRYPKLSKC